MSRKKDTFLEGPRSTYYRESELRELAKFLRSRCSDYLRGRLGVADVDLAVNEWLSARKRNPEGD